MRSSVIRTLFALGAALGMSAACGARDDGLDLEDFDPGSGGDGGTGAVSGRGGGGRGGSLGRGGVSGRGGESGRGGAFGSDGVGGTFGMAGAFGSAGRAGGFGRGGTFGSAGTFGRGGTFGSAGTFGRGGTFGSAGRFGTGGIGPDGSVGTGGRGGRGGSAGRGGDGGLPDGGIENCLNGLDDDGDNLIDCADPNCNAGFTCTPPPPDGWVGPVALWQGTAAPSPTVCSDNGFQQVAATLFAGVIAAPAMCAGCVCDSPVDVSCPEARISFSASATCAAPLTGLTIPSNLCHAFLLPIDARSVRWESVAAQGGFCSPSTNGESTLPPLRWSRHAAACFNSTPGGGCSTGTCQPRPTAPLGSRTCIAQVGEFTCPSQYPQRSLYYFGVQDNRGCTECSCATPTGASCSGQLLVTSDSVCSAERTTIRTIGTCATVGPDPTPPAPPIPQSRSAVYRETGASGGTCRSSGGSATGSAEDASPVTFCCAALQPVGDARAD
jgi:hypothetical protein